MIEQSLQMLEKEHSAYFTKLDDVEEKLEELLETQRIELNNGTSTSEELRELQNQIDKLQEDENKLEKKYTELTKAKNAVQTAINVIASLEAKIDLTPDDAGCRVFTILNSLITDQKLLKFLQESGNPDFRLWVAKQSQNDIQKITDFSLQLRSNLESQDRTDIRKCENGTYPNPMACFMQGMVQLKSTQPITIFRKLINNCTCLENELLNVFLCHEKNSDTRELIYSNLATLKSLAKKWEIDQNSPQQCQPAQSFFAKTTVSPKKAALPQTQPTSPEKLPLFRSIPAKRTFSERELFHTTDENSENRSATVKGPIPKRPRTVFAI